jgi:Sulfotransferase family
VEAACTGRGGGSRLPADDEPRPKTAVTGPTWVLGGAPARARPILVTGSHRSGTTWVGRILARAPGVLYVHEPFNLGHPPGRGVCNVRPEHWFAHVTAENEAAYRRAFENTIGLRYDWLVAARSVTSVRDARRLWAERRLFRRHRRAGSVPLIKDPLAFFSVEWLAARFDMNVIVLIRHPAAFASSLKLLGWSFPFSDLLAQPRLMGTFLRPFAAEAFAAVERPVLDQAVLQWRLIYHTVLEYRRLHPGWIFVRHEDLSRDPVGGFRGLFARLGLAFTAQARRAVEEYSGAHNPVQPAVHIGSEFALRRDSASNVSNWRRRLTAAEIAHIRDGVAPIADRFYAEMEW